MENNSPINVLVSCFACGPNWGSEVGMGWNWVINLSKYCQLHVMTEEGFQKEIEAEISKLNLTYPPVFYYLDIGEKGRNLFWKQGSLLFYYFYKKWQKKAFVLSQKLIQKHEIQLIHQLNLIGFREPGYLWKHGKERPFIWGPVGGINQIPLNYILHFDLKNLIFYSSKNLIHQLQLTFSPRVSKSLRAAKFVVSESSNTQKILKKRFNTASILIHETACNLLTFNFTEKNNSLIELIWVGKIQGTKALPIALKALAKVKEKEKFHLTIIGDGPDEKFCKRLSKNLGIGNLCTFLGRIPNKEVIDKIGKSDLLFFTSLKEGTPTVISEAFSSGVPVLCHDTCGFGDIVNQDSGIKIPMVSYKLSVKYFCDSLTIIAKDKSVLLKLSIGALKECEKLTWEVNSKKMYDLYLSSLQQTNLMVNNFHVFP